MNVCVVPNIGVLRDVVRDMLLRVRGVVRVHGRRLGEA
jgi:hypothetical protein